MNARHSRPNSIASRLQTLTSRNHGDIRGHNVSFAHLPTVQAKSPAAADSLPKVVAGDGGHPGAHVRVGQHQVGMEKKGWRPRTANGPMKRLLTFLTLMTLMLVMFTTFTRLKPCPHQGKNGSKGPTGHQPMLPKPKPTRGPKPKKNTKAGDQIGR